MMPWFCREVFRWEPMPPWVARSITAKRLKLISKIQQSFIFGGCLLCHFVVGVAVLLFFRIVVLFCCCWLWLLVVVVVVVGLNPRTSKSPSFAVLSSTLPGQQLIQRSSGPQVTASLGMAIRPEDHRENSSLRFAQDCADWGTFPWKLPVSPWAHCDHSSRCRYVMGEWETGW